MTGEHGIGVEKIDFMESNSPKTILDAMRALRKVFLSGTAATRTKCFPAPNVARIFPEKTDCRLTAHDCHTFSCRTPACDACSFARKGKIERVELGALNRILEYTPEDMTVTVEAGLTLASLQTELARHAEWLPVDPPHPERVTMGELIDANASGPRRFGYGTIRDFLIGIKVALADGRIIHSGGKVWSKMSPAMTTAKLFIGGRGSLGVVIETTLASSVAGNAERFVQAACPSRSSKLKN